MITSCSSGAEDDNITINIRENPTPQPHPSPQHTKSQPPLRPSSQNTANPQTLMDGTMSSAPPRKLSTPFHTGSGVATPVDSPTVARRPLVFTQGERNRYSIFNLLLCDTYLLL